MAPPAAEYLIDGDLVERLLAAQFPALAGLPLRHLDSGFDNEMYRLGDDLLVRLPRRQIADELLRNEQRWLPKLAPLLPLTIPAPLCVGEPMFGYPWTFSILPWQPGEAADLGYPQPSEALVLAACLRALHDSAPADVLVAPDNDVRGVPLAQRSSATLARLERLSKLPGVELPFAGIYRLWEEALAAAPSVNPVWLQGDLHARNVLVQEGKLVSIIDWGDITSGDPATDLASFWMLFADAAARSAGLAAYVRGMPGVQGAPAVALIARSKGWACSFATMLLDSSLADDGSVEHERHQRMGYATFANLCA